MAANPVPRHYVPNTMMFMGDQRIYQGVLYTFTVQGPMLSSDIEDEIAKGMWIGAGGGGFPGIEMPPGLPADFPDRVLGVNADMEVVAFERFVFDGKEGARKHSRVFRTIDLQPFRDASGISFTYAPGVCFETCINQLELEMLDILSDPVDVPAGLPMPVVPASAIPTGGGLALALFYSPALQAFDVRWAVQPMTWNLSVFVTKPPGHWRLLLYGLYPDLSDPDNFSLLTGEAHAGWDVAMIMDRTDGGGDVRAATCLCARLGPPGVRRTWMQTERFDRDGSVVNLSTTTYTSVSGNAFRRWRESRLDGSESTDFWDPLSFQRLSESAMSQHGFGVEGNLHASQLQTSSLHAQNIQAGVLGATLIDTTTLTTNQLTTNVVRVVHHDAGAMDLDVTGSLLLAHGSDILLDASGTVYPDYREVRVFDSMNGMRFTLYMTGGPGEVRLSIAPGNSAVLWNGLLQFTSLIVPGQRMQITMVNLTVYLSML